MTGRGRAEVASRPPTRPPLPHALGLLGALALIGLLLLGLSALALADRTRGLVRAVALLGGAVLMTAPLVEAGARVALMRGLVHPTAKGDVDALFRDGPDPDFVEVGGMPRVPRHLLPEGTRQQGPAPDRARILVLGDSFSHGEGVRPADTFATRLGALVHPDDGRPVEVVNLSQSRLDAASEHTLFLAYGQTFVPDVVVWVFVPNDLGGGQLDVAGTRYDDLIVDREELGTSWSTAFALARHAVRSRRQEDAVVASYRASFTPVALEELQRRYEDVAAAVRAQGGRLLVVTFPLLWRLDELPLADLSAEVLARAEAAGAETLDLGPAFAGRDPAPLWASPRDHHPNAAGHAVAAEAIAAAIGTAIPRAHPAPCAPGAGDVALALCTTPGVATGLALAREVTRPMDADPRPLFLLSAFASTYTWLAADALPPAERDAVRAELVALATRVMKPVPPPSGAAAAVTARSAPPR